MKATPLISEVSESYKNKNDFIHKINLAWLYFILLILILGVIYFYSVYRNEYLSILIPFTKIWPITMILVGISIFRVTNFSSFAVGFLLVSSLVAITIASIFVQTALIKDITETKLVSVLDVSKIDSKINLMLTNAKLEDANVNFLKVESISNYDSLDINSYKDDSGAEQITLNHNGLPNGVGSYSKITNVVFPNSIPAMLDLQSMFSKLDVNFKTLKISSGNFDLVGSDANIVVSGIDNSAAINIKSILSQVNLTVDSNINVTFSASSNMTQQDLVGLKPSIIDNRIYKSINTDGIDSSKKDERPELIITLSSTLSKVTIIQKDI